MDRQCWPYPSLEDVGRLYGVGGKVDEVKEFWDRGIQTSEIPRDILDKYVLQDVELTYQVYQKQQELIRPHQKTLFRLDMLDLLCLEEIEWNGIKYDRHGIQQKAEEIEAELLKIQSELDIRHSVPDFNWNSPNHLSALLFGGTIVQERRVPCGTYKSGKRAGEVKYKKELVEFHLPRLFKPIRKTETGKFATGEDILVQLGDSDLIQKILRIRELQKLCSNYLRGFLEKAQEYNFEPDFIHAQFNQVVTRTGRLSSSKPNLQNTPEELDEYLISRFS